MGNNALSLAVQYFVNGLDPPDGNPCERDCTTRLHMAQLTHLNASFIRIIVNDWIFHSNTYLVRPVASMQIQPLALQRIFELLKHM